MQIHTVSGAPLAIGPYCHATQVGKLVFCSGQTPLDPQTMELVGSTIEEQTEQALSNLAVVLNSLGLSLQNVVKTAVFLKDMADF
jgi:2-iminobutanoate/2-iminopropanoate deaminase